MNILLLILGFRVLRIFLILAVVYVGIVPVRAAMARKYPSAPPIVAEPVDDWSDARAGDVVFIQIGGPLFSRVAASSNTWVSHVGIIVGQKDGQWLVAEGAVPWSRLTPLPRFIHRSVHGQYAIKRLKSEWTPEQLAALRSAADHRMGKAYDFGFNLDSNRSTFCSKFVYQVVRESKGQQLGDVETFRSLFAHTPSAPVWFWRAWYFGRIPWQRRTITPESQYQSPLMVTVRAHA